MDPLDEFIVRDRSIEKIVAPWDALNFRLDVWSDKLHKTLRRKYPELGNTQLRKIAALRDFLSQELASALVNLPDEGRGGQSSSSDQDSTPDESKQASTATSPASNSLRPAQHDVEPPTERRSSNTSLQQRTAPPPDQMGVFDLRDGSTVKQKHRRRMNPQERTNYQERRKVGSCEACRLAKKKCIHPSSRDNAKRKRSLSPATKAAKIRIEPGKPLQSGSSGIDRLQIGIKSPPMDHRTPPYDDRGSRSQQGWALNEPEPSLITYGYDTVPTFDQLPPEALPSPSGQNSWDSTGQTVHGPLDPGFLTNIPSQSRDAPNPYQAVQSPTGPYMDYLNPYMDPSRPD